LTYSKIHIICLSMDRSKPFCIWFTQWIIIFSEINHFPYLSTICIYFNLIWFWEVTCFRTYFIKWRYKFLIGIKFKIKMTS
jgi:hypothetical protein